MNKEFIDCETENLILRQICMADKKNIFEQFSNKEVCKFLNDEEPFKSMEEAEELINRYASAERRNLHRWVIIRKNDNAFLGTCGYANWDRKNNSCEIGYDLRSEYWGKGYMTEALKAIIKVGFENMGLNKIQGFVYVQNEKSKNILLKLGFNQDGIMRDMDFLRSQYYDNYCFSLLQREW